MLYGSLSDNLHKLMSSARISSSKLSLAVGIEAASIRKLRTGENSNPTQKTLIALAHYFGITISQLIGETPLSGADDNGSINLVKKINIFDWTNVPGMNNTQEVIYDSIIVDAKYSLDCKTFGLIMDSDDNMLFKKNGVLLVNPKLQPNNGNYVLIYKPEQKRPSLKKLIIDDDILYGKSIVTGISNTVQIDVADKILGVVIAYIYNEWFFIN